jgi:hypothetical protein
MFDLYAVLQRGIANRGAGLRFDNLAFRTDLFMG